MRQQLTESERAYKLDELTYNLPPLTDGEIWVWTEKEIAMLRAAGAKRFDELIRTETLFCIAATGIRIFKDRLAKHISTGEEL